MAGTWGDEWDRVVDVVVVGAGAAGASAAATAAAAGASVLVLEKGTGAGGTTAASRCQMWIPNNRFLRERGLVDGREDALRYMARTGYPTLYDPDDASLGIPADRYRLLEAFYDNAAATIDFFIDNGAAEVEPVDWPSYYAHLPEETCPVGRTIQPVLADDYVPGRDPSGGQVFVDRLIEFAVQRGAGVLAEHEAVHLIRNDFDEVVGVEARAGMRTVLIGARRGVIFASGGFLHDERLAMDHLRGPVFGGAASPNATGDFVRVGTEAGARLGNMAHAWWDQVVVELAVLNRATRGDVYSPFGDSMLMVNRYGRRAVNEKAPYNERGQGHFAWDSFRGEYPNLLLFMIFDSDVVKSDAGATLDPEQAMFRWPVPSDDRPRHYVIKVDTLEDLVVELDERLERLGPHTGGVQLDESFLPTVRETISRFNGFASEGRDPEFHRGETPIEQAWASPPRPGAPSGSMYPLSSEGPYYCVILGPGALDTKGGPVTDERARVIDTSGNPIPGLYGAGNCVASPAGQAYWGPGGTIGPAVTFGAIAAGDAAAQAERVPS
jgi:succinate dehydrogenase/fumarate reductase flavoprotein subunit